MLRRQRYKLVLSLYFLHVLSRLLGGKGWVDGDGDEDEGEDEDGTHPYAPKVSAGLEPLLTAVMNTNRASASWKHSKSKTRNTP